MFLTCPNCETVFRIDSTRIGKSGRAVRCSICSHVWQAESKRQRDASAGSGGVAIFAMLVLTAVTLAAIATAAIQYRSTLTAYAPGLLAAFERVGFRVYPQLGELRIEDLEADYAGDTLRLRGRIVNNSALRVHAPPLHVLVNDARGGVLADTLIRPDRDVITANGSTEFFAQLVLEADKVPTLTVTMRNDPVIWHLESGIVPTTPEGIAYYESPVYPDNPDLASGSAGTSVDLGN